MNLKSAAELETLSASAAKYIPDGVVSNLRGDGYMVDQGIYLYQSPSIWLTILNKVLCADPDKPVVVEFAADGCSFQIGKGHLFCYNYADYSQDLHLAFNIMVLTTLVALNYVNVN